MLAFDKLPRLCCSQNCASSSRTRPFVAGRLCCGFKSVIPITAPSIRAPACHVPSCSLCAHRTSHSSRRGLAATPLWCRPPEWQMCSCKGSRIRSVVPGLFALCSAPSYLSHAACLKALRPNDALPLSLHGSAILAGPQQICVNEIQSGCIYGFVGRALQRNPEKRIAAERFPGP